MKGDLFISVKWLCCILYALLCFLCFVSFQISLFIMSGTKYCNNLPLKMEAIGTREPDG